VKDIQQLNDVGSTACILQDFDFTFDFLLLDQLENSDDTLCIIHNIDSLEYLRL
jgi:hypothetical protein